MSAAALALAVLVALGGGGALARAAPAGWQVVWQQPVPLLTAPLQAGTELVYAFSGNEVRALHTATGMVVWAVQPPPPQGRALLLGCCQAGATPTDAGLYTLAGGNEVWSLDPQSGAVLWQQALGEAVLAPPVAAPPLVVTLALDGEETVLVGLESATGEVRWRAELGATAPRLVARDGVVFVPLAAGGVAAYRALDGRWLWSARLDGRPAPVTTRQFWQDLLAIPTEDGMVALDAQSGQQRWATRVAGLPLDPQMRDGSVYLHTVEGAVLALDAASGAERWRAEVGPYAVSALGGPTEGRLFAAGPRGVVALDTASGQTLWEWAGGEVYARPLVMDGALSVGTVQGDLVALDPASGAELSRVPLGGQIFLDPLVATTELLLVAADKDAGSLITALSPSRDLGVEPGDGSTEPRRWR